MSVNTDANVEVLEVSLITLTPGYYVLHLNLIDPALSSKLTTDGSRSKQVKKFQTLLKHRELAEKNSRVASIKQHSSGGADLTNAIKMF